MSTTESKPCCKHLHLRTLIFVFVVLSVLGMTNIFFTSSPSSLFAVDVAMRVKTNVSNVVRDFIKVNKERASNDETVQLNKTLLIETNSQENISAVTLNLPVENEVPIYRRNVPNVTKHVHDILKNYNRSAIKITTVQYDILGHVIVKGESNHTNNSRKVECNSCFNHDFKYLINNPDICKLTSGQTEIELLIIILTVHNNTLKRHSLRETWLTYSQNNSANVRYAFLFGKIQSTELQDLLSKESETFEDIVQENFKQAYSNLTYKTIMGFKWAASYCSVAKAVLKTDDDMYINVPNVLDIVRKDFILLHTNVFGACSQVARPHRDPTSKWFASVQSYPGKSYPGYCSGTGYLTNLNVARKVFEISRHVPFFHL